jgi:osmotically-inducible protein OsmY
MGKAMLWLSTPGYPKSTHMNFIKVLSSTVAILAVAGTAYADSQDAVNSSRVDARLQQAAAHSDVNVQTVNGNMELTGIVENSADATTAMLSARDVMMSENNGLHQVTNNLTIRYPDFGHGTK